MTRTAFTIIAILALAAPSAMALIPDDELWIPAAVRGAGKSGSYWITDLHVMNLGEEEVTVEITWFDRWADNSDAEGFPFDLEAGETLVLEDIISSVFGESTAAGAIHVEIVEEDEDDLEAMDEGEEDEGEDEDESVLIANARIYNLKDGTTFGQGLEGFISDAAISADGEDTTHVVGISHNDSFRSSFYGLNISMDEEDEAEEAEVLVEVLDLDGSTLVAHTFEMAPFAPVLYSLADLGISNLDNGALRFTMLEGEGIFGATKVDKNTNDSTNLEPHWECEGDDGEDEFSDEFFADDCTFVTTGRNPFWIPLVPGYEMVLEGEEDGEEIAVTINVLNQTKIVDGVETRVIREHETIDGEVVEISFNYFALCQETGSVFYFGEDVDIYEDGEVVSHDGAWLAGEDGAVAGIIMPGTVLLGSRYYQEVAPGIALDRAEHVAMGVTIETEAGTFEDCLRVEETTPLEPDDLSVKVYAPGVGLVFDDVIELIEVTDPSAK